MLNQTPKKTMDEIMDLFEASSIGQPISEELYRQYDVKRGLRDLNGKGVLTGLTNISEICSSKMVDGKSVPCDGKLYYRGYDVEDIVNGFVQEDRFGFEETAYLLIFGRMPTKRQLEEFEDVLASYRTLPTSFVRDIIMKAPSPDMMNTLARSVLTLYSYDDNANDISLPNVLRQCLELIALFPMLSVYGYQAYNHYVCGQSLFIHQPQPQLSTRKISCTACARTTATPSWKPGCWTSPWCSMRNTAAATTPPSPPTWSPVPAPTPIR